MNERHWISDGAAVNVKRNVKKLREMERHARTRGYSDGYRLLPAQSVNAVYQESWRKGRAARQAFDSGDAA